MMRKIAFLVLLSCFYFGLSHPAICHSQTAEKFIILNLHWEKNAIRLNALHVAEGIFKKKRVLSDRGNYFYRVLSRDQAVIDEGYFDVPRFLQFDYLDNEKGQLRGGHFLRGEGDFVIKIPAHENSYKVLFYRLKDATDTGISIKADTVKADSGDMIGEIGLRENDGI